MGPLIGLVAVIMFLGIPLSAIVGNYWWKFKRLQLEKGVGPNVEARLKSLELENADLRRRLEMVESIIVSDLRTPDTRVKLTPDTHRNETEDAHAHAHEGASREGASRRGS